MDSKVVAAVAKARALAEELLEEARVEVARAARPGGEPLPDDLASWVYRNTIWALWSGAMTFVAGSENPAARLEQFRRQVSLGDLETDGGPMAEAVYRLEADAYEDWDAEVGSILADEASATKEA